MYSCLSEPKAPSQGWQDYNTTIEYSYLHIPISTLIISPKLSPNVEVINIAHKNRLTLSSCKAKINYPYKTVNLYLQKDINNNN